MSLPINVPVYTSEFPLPLGPQRNITAHQVAADRSRFGRSTVGTLVVETAAFDDASFNNLTSLVSTTLNGTVHAVCTGPISLQTSSVSTTALQLTSGGSIALASGTGATSLTSASTSTTQAIILSAPTGGIQVQAGAGALALAGIQGITLNAVGTGTIAATASLGITASTAAGDVAVTSIGSMSSAPTVPGSLVLRYTGTLVTQSFAGAVFTPSAANSTITAADVQGGIVRFKATTSACTATFPTAVALAATIFSSGAGPAIGDTVKFTFINAFGSQLVRFLAPDASVTLDTANLSFDNSSTNGVPIASQRVVHCRFTAVGGSPAYTVYA